MSHSGSRDPAPSLQRTSWSVGIGLSAANATMTAITPVTPMTVPPTIPADVPVTTVAATSGPNAPSTPDTSELPSESPVSAADDGNTDVLGCDVPLFDPNAGLDAPEIERAIGGGTKKW